MTKPDDIGIRLTVVGIGVVVASLLALVLWNEKPFVEALAISLVTTGFLTILFDRLVKPGYNTVIANAAGEAQEELRRVVQQEAEHVTGVVTRVVREMPEMVTRQSSTAARRVYPESDTPDPDLNRDMYQSMVGSKSYLFQGVSGKYVSARLDPAHWRPSTVHLVLQHPADEDGVTMRAAEREGDQKYAHMSLEARIEVVRQDIRCSVVGMFDHRHSRAVFIGFSQRTALLTVEVFDRDVFVRDWPDGNNRHTFPQMYVYEGESPLYTVFHKTIDNQCRLGRPTWRVGREWDDTKLIQELRGLGYEDYDEDALAADREAIKRFREKYRAALSA